MTSRIHVVCSTTELTELLSVTFLSCLTTVSPSGASPDMLGFCTGRNPGDELLTHTATSSGAPYHCVGAVESWGWFDGGNTVSIFG